MIRANEIKKANELLRDLDSLYPGFDGAHQLFMWKWSTDLWDLVPAFDRDGNIIYDYHCHCGVNVNVHTPECEGLTAATQKMVKMDLVSKDGPAASYPNMWMLCRWEPPMSLADWKDEFGSENGYSSEGRYVPCSRGVNFVVIPPKAPASSYVPTTQKVIAMHRENVEKIEEARRKANEKPPLEVPIYDKRGNMIDGPPRNSVFWALKDRIKDAMRRFNPSATVGYGQKSADVKVRISDRSLADPGSALHRLREEQKRDQAADLSNSLTKVSKEEGVILQP